MCVGADMDVVKAIEFIEATIEENERGNPHSPNLTLSEIEAIEILIKRVKELEEGMIEAKAWIRALRDPNDNRSYRFDCSGAWLEENEHL